MMKVLVLAPRPLLPLYDGGTVASARCISGLASAGARVTVLSMITGKHASAANTYRESKPEYLHEYQTVQVDTRIKFHSLLLNLFFSELPYDLVRFRSPGYSRALRSVLARNNFDIIQCEGLPFALYLDEIRAHSRAPVILRAHNLEHRIREMMAEGEKSCLRKKYLSTLSRRLKSLEKKAASEFDAIIAISGPDGRWFTSEARGKPVRICETGADEAGYTPEEVHSNPRVGFIGSMHWQPNVDAISWFIAEVWPCVLKEMPSAELQIAGRNLDSVRESLPTGNRITYVNEPEDARRFITSNNVMIAPLFAGSGLRIKIIEAMSAGRPVVASQVAAEGIEAGTGSGLTVASDARTFCAAIIRYLEDRELRSSAGKAAVEVVREKYDNRSLTAGLLEFYTALAHDR